MAKISRNAPCPCGSGKKYKKCCIEKDLRKSPSIEMLDDGMQEGYDFMMNGNGAQACDCCWPLWEIIRSRLDPEMRTCESASSVFKGTQELFNWVQDFALELHNAAVDETRYAEIGVRLCQDVLTQFRDEKGLFHLNFRADLGEFYYMASRPEEGERVLLDLIRDHPDHAAGYARLADILAYGAGQDDPPIDRQRARALLESAIARPVSDPVGLTERLDDLLES